ncbi:ATP-binding protein [Arthrobacter cryoconiti]|uniref:PspC domain-containing protein n=1 Tax=Arthrobacter cryoconiti TaxID=748907 RepID=A0ABV8QZ73_9MICC|nr:ATP-binding protein [Arthrobacter cryoconiti]MCC9069186.1 PspC domain-containing protein [Arthrobacter cryoconiti]
MSPKMYRSTDRRVAGVCAGLAEHLGLRVGLVRAIMAASCFVFGAGVVFYAWLWILVPLEGEEQSLGTPLLDADGTPYLKLFRPAPESSFIANSDTREATATQAGRSLGIREIMVGAVLVVAAFALFSGPLIRTVNVGTLIPITVIGIGAVLAWMQLDATRRAGLLNAANIGTPLAIVRFSAGIGLVIAGVLIAVSGSGSWSLAWSSAMASLAVLAGVGLVLAPWALKFWRDFQKERTGRIRQTERAEIAAHLHDSVLQTLALIQKRADSPQDVTRLARAQERELREWIYHDADETSGALVARIKSVCAEIEDLHGLAVEVVAVGDAELTEQRQPLVQATREAVLNGVRHGGTTVSVYVEAGVKGVEVFVRDRGSGFDVESMPADRLGVRESVVGRMQRNGGTAGIMSSSEGTEVRLYLPIGEPTMEDMK